MRIIANEIICKIYMTKLHHILKSDEKQHTQIYGWTAKMI